MARGLPIVCTTGGAAASTVPDAAAIKVPPADVAALSEAVCRLLDNPPLRRRLSDAAWAAGQKLPRWEATARIIAGVDSPLVPYGISLHGELEEYVAAGLTPYQALQTATVNPARLLAADADLGTLQVGKLADLIVVEGDPLTDIKAARRVRTVIKNGEVYQVSALIQKGTN